MYHWNFNLDRPLSILTVGRAGIDLNTLDVDCSFAENRGYTKSVGGSPANIAQALARLNIPTGFIGKVAGNGMGEYIKDTFEAAGINTQGLIFDKTGAPNCLAVTYILSPSNCGSFFYRNGTADLLLSPEDISEDYIKSAAAVLISGTALSETPSRDAVFTILEYAKKHSLKIIMDIDYRPYGWESVEEASEYYNKILEHCHIIIGNREEFNVVEQLTMKGNKDNEKSALWFLDKNAELVVIKDGERGSVGYTNNQAPVSCGIIKTKALKTFGSGDAFAAGLIYGLVHSMELIESLRFGSACASIALQTVSCTEGLPNCQEVEEYLKNHVFTE